MSPGHSTRCGAAIAPRLNQPARTASKDERAGFWGVKLYHTSPDASIPVHAHGLLGSFLCFASRPYVMTAASECYVYSIEIEESEFIEARALFHHERASELDGLVAEFAARFGLQTDDAEDIIAERAQLDSGDADELWHVQHVTCRAAKYLGFSGVVGRDEQGTVYMIDMLGRESELRRE